MTDMQKRIDELSKQIDKEWIALNDQKMKIFELTIERDTLVLKKEIEMKNETNHNGTIIIAETNG